MLNIKALVALSFLAITQASMASSLSDFTPIKIKENLNGLNLIIESKMVNKISVVKITSKESTSVNCRVTFKDGPSPASIRRTSLAPGGSKLLSKAFGRSLNGLRLEVDCQKKQVEV